VQQGLSCPYPSFLMSYTLYPVRVKEALLFRPITYTNIAMGEDGGSTSVEEGHELGIDLTSFPFQDLNDAVAEDGDLQFSKSADWLEMFEMSGFGVGGDIDGGDGTFRDGGGFLKADSNFTNISSAPKMDDRAPQTVFEIENYDSVLGFDNVIPLRCAADFEFTEYTGTPELDMTTLLADFSL
jgi:hypothetical protein